MMAAEDKSHSARGAWIETHKMLVKVIDADDNGEPEQAEHEVLTEQYLEKLTKKKLVEIAKEKGIQLDEAMTKKEMIKELI